MTIPTLPCRRWFQFGLRTMFVVVTVVAVYLGWQLSIVHERQAIKDIGWYESADEAAENGQPKLDAHIPVWRAWLGDEPVATLLLPPRVADAELARAKVMFPEADVRQGPSVWPYIGLRQQKYGPRHIAPSSN